VNLGNPRGAFYLFAFVAAIILVLLVVLVNALPQRPNLSPPAGFTPAAVLSPRTTAVAEPSRSPSPGESDAGQSVAGMPPVVVETFPVSGANGVQFIGRPHYEANGHTCVVRVKLEPGRLYGWWLNNGEDTGFTDRAGRPSVPYLLLFRTKAN
jgi:hypothetical protein